MRMFCAGLIAFLTLFVISAYAASSDAAALDALRNQMFQLQASNKQLSTQCSKASDQAKKVQDNLTQLGSQVKSQIEKSQDASSSMVKELQTGLQKQLQTLESTLNDLKARLSKQGPKAAAKSTS